MTTTECDRSSPRRCELISRHSAAATMAADGALAETQMVGPTGGIR
jgi:hypothetical protein